MDGHRGRQGLIAGLSAQPGEARRSFCARPSANPAGRRKREAREENQRSRCTGLRSRPAPAGLRRPGQSGTRRGREGQQLPRRPRPASPEAVAEPVAQLLRLRAAPDALRPLRPLQPHPRQLPLPHAGREPGLQLGQAPQRPSPGPRLDPLGPAPRGAAEPPVPLRRRGPRGRAASARAAPRSGSCTPVGSQHVALWCPGQHATPCGGARRTVPACGGSASTAAG